MILIQNLVRIDKTLPEPVYQQLSNGIASIIQEGVLAPGTPLPSSRRLAEAFGIHRKTVVAAFDELQAMGWAESYPRKGLFVAAQLPVQKPRAVGPAPCPPPKAATAYPAETDFPVEKRLYLYDHPFVARKERLVFNDGFPDTRLAPVELLIREYRRFSNYRFTAKFLSYGPAQGSENLRNELARFLNQTRGLAVSPANIMITKGVQMAMWLTSQILLRQGDEVVVAEPGYLGASEVFRTAGATLNFVPIDEDGMDVDAVERICATKKVRMVFVIPHHHTPTTVTLCAERRRQLLELAKKYRFAVLEDDYDFDFHYSSSPILPLASADTCGNVVYVGSFCKTVAPAIRIGFMVAPANLIEQAANLRKLVDRQGEQLMEEAMANLLRNGDIDRHLKKAGKIYHERRDLLCALLERHLKGRVEFSEPCGGFAVWARFMGGLTTRAVAAQAQRLGLAIADGEDYWHLKDGPRNGVRLGFASLNEKEMEEAVGLLRKAVDLAAAAAPGGTIAN
jgi:GntR family transcriptional regulator / MocR family aminotransferase